MGLADYDRPRYPLEGFPVDELAAALVAMVASPEVGQVRVLRVEARGDGHLLVQTGFQAGIRAGAGKYVLLRRHGNRLGRRGGQPLEVLTASP